MANKNKIKGVKVQTAEELAHFLGLPESEALDIEIRSDLNTKIINTVQKKNLTHEQVSKLAGTSRTRVTAVMNRNTMDISTDLMLRILGALGIRAKLVFPKAS
jgi:predicted XRE-type DNA-binding protein